jgi:hypothetical protein
VPNPSQYRPVFSEGAADFLIQLSKRRQQKVLALARQLAERPFVRSDYSLPDESGRDMEHLLIDEFVFVYWVDHAVREVRIAEIEDAS